MTLQFLRRGVNPPKWGVKLFLGGSKRGGGFSLLKEIRIFGNILNVEHFNVKFVVIWRFLSMVPEEIRSTSNEDFDSYKSDALRQYRDICRVSWCCSWTILNGTFLATEVMHTNPEPLQRRDTTKCFHIYYRSREEIVNVDSLTFRSWNWYRERGLSSGRARIEGRRLVFKDKFDEGIFFLFRGRLITLGLEKRFPWRALPPIRPPRPPRSRGRKRKEACLRKDRFSRCFSTFCTTFPIK